MASKIKIKVIDKESNFRLWLPAIPFWLITFLSSLALKFKPIILKNADDLDEDSKMLFEVLDSNIIKQFIYELKANGKFDLVDISAGDGTTVKISIL